MPEVINDNDSQRRETMTLQERVEKAFDLNEKIMRLQVKRDALILNSGLTYPEFDKEYCKYEALVNHKGERQCEG